MMQGISAAIFIVWLLWIASIVINYFIEKREENEISNFRRQQKEQSDRVQRLIDGKEFDRAKQQINAKRDKKGNYYVLDQDGNWLKKKKNGTWSKIEPEDM